MRVNIDTKVLSDFRFIILAKALNRTKGEALGLMALLWMHCQENRTDVMTSDLIDAVVEKKSFTSIAIGSQLFEDLGEKRFRVLGVKERLLEFEDKTKKQSDKGKLSAEKRWGNITTVKKECNQNITTVKNKNNRGVTPYSNSNSNSNSNSELEDMSEMHPPPSAAAPEGNHFLSEDEANGQLFEVEVVDEKKLKNDPKSVRPPKPKPQVSEADLDLGKRWNSWTVNLSPHINATPASFAVGIFETKRALARSIPNGDLDALLEAIFAFVQRDPFWGKNCLSPCGLLAKSSNGLRKVDNVIKEMRKGEFREKQRSISPESEVDWKKYI